MFLMGTSKIRPEALKRMIPNYPVFIFESTFLSQESVMPINLRLVMKMSVLFLVVKISKLVTC